jgi:hypothetical protein
MSRLPGNSRDSFWRRAAAKSACSRAAGTVFGRSAQPLPMYSLNVSDTGVVERLDVARGAFVGALSEDWAMTSIVHPSTGKVQRQGQDESQEAGARVATIGRWSLPAPSSVGMTRIEMVFHAAVYMT